MSGRAMFLFQRRLGGSIAFVCLEGGVVEQLFLFLRQVRLGRAILLCFCRMLRIATVFVLEEVWYSNYSELFLGEALWSNSSCFCFGGGLVK